LPAADRERWPDDAALLELIASTCSGAMGAVANAGRPIWLALSSGHDSRFLLAAAHARGVRGITTYTQTYAWPAMSRSDRRLPPRIAATAGCEHVYLTPGPESAARLRAMDEHTYGMMVDADRAFYAQGQWDDVPRDAVVLRGGVLEVAVGFYYPRLPAAPADFYASIDESFGVSLYHAASQAHTQGLREWADWITANPQSGMDWRDRMYLEQRDGAWVASIEQALDLTGTTRLYLGNCHELLSMWLTLPGDRRERRGAQIEVLRRLSPELSALPLNPPDGRVQRGARRVQIEWGRLRAAPRKGAFVAQRGAAAADLLKQRLSRK
jgi:hypothetical protein